MYIYSDKGGDSARNSPKNEPKTIDKNPFFAPKLNKNEVLSETAYVNQRFLPYFGREASIETLFRAKKSKKVSPKISQTHPCRWLSEATCARKTENLTNLETMGGPLGTVSPVTEHISTLPHRVLLSFLQITAYFRLLYLKISEARTFKIITWTCFSKSYGMICIYRLNTAKTEQLFFFRL